VFETDESFQNCLRLFSEDFQKKRAHPSEEEFNYQVSKSNEYFLEEFAVIACMIKRGNKVMVYPGSFNIFEEIPFEQYPDSQVM